MLICLRIQGAEDPINKVHAVNYIINIRYFPILDELPLKRDIELSSEQVLSTFWFLTSGKFKIYSLPVEELSSDAAINSRKSG